MTLKHKITLVCSVSVAVCALCVALAGWHLFETERVRTTKGAQQALEDLVVVTKIIDDAYRQHNLSAMRVMKRMLAQEGSLMIVAGDKTLVGGQEMPALYFGERKITLDTGIVDDVVKQQGGTATIFVKKGEDFWRVATNVKKDDGSRAVGTALDRKGKAYAAITEGKPFYGLVNILGKPYLTGYEPILDDTKVVGITYVGMPLTALEALKDKITNAAITRNGFVAMHNAEGAIVYTSSNAPKTTEEITSRLDGKVAGWEHLSKPYEAWGYHFEIAFPLSDVWASVLGQMVVVVGVLGEFS